MVELRQSPIYEAQLRRITVSSTREANSIKPIEDLDAMGDHLSFLMIYHDIMWFHISMHDPLRMAEV